MLNLFKSAKKRYVLGIIAAAWAAVSFGLVPILAKYYYASDGNVLSLIFFRTFLSSVCAMYVISRLKGYSLKISKLQLKRIITFSVFVLGVFAAYFSAILYAPVSLVVVVFFLYPSVVLIIERLTGMVKGSLMQYIGSICAFVAVYLSVGAPGLSNSAIEFQWYGIILALLGGVFMAANMVVQTKVASQLPASVYGVYVGLVITFILSVFVFVTDYQLVLGSLTILGLIVLFTVIQDVAIAYSLKTLGATLSSQIMGFEPVFATILAGLLLGEVLSVVQYFGIVLMFFAMLLIRKKSKKQRVLHEAIDT